MNLDLTKWGVKEIVDVLYASGYKDDYDEIFTAKYIKTNERNQAVFEIKFDDDGMVGKGFVYVGIRNGKLEADY